MLKRLVILALLPWALLQANELTVIDGDRQWQFSAEELLNIAPAALTTITPWDDEASTFEGIYLSELITTLDIDTDQLTAVALNNYRINLDLAGAIEAGAFIAAQRDGKAMPVRQKGPFWIIFPWSDGAELSDPQLASWAIWQLKTLHSDGQ